MKNSIRFMSIGLLAWFCVCPIARGVEQIKQDDRHADFEQPIGAVAFDPVSGSLFLACNIDNGDYTLAKTVRGADVCAPLRYDHAQSRANNYVVKNNNGAAIDLNHLPTSLLQVMRLPDATVLCALQDTKVSVFDADIQAPRYARQSYDLKDAHDYTNGRNAELIDPADNDGMHRLCVGIVKDSDGNVDLGKVFVYGYAQHNLAGSEYAGICSLNMRRYSGIPIAAESEAEQFSVANGFKNGAYSFLGGTSNNGGNEGNFADGSVADNGGWINDVYWDNDLQLLYAGFSAKAFADQDDTYCNYCNGLLKIGVEGVETAYRVKSFDEALVAYQAAAQAVDDAGGPGNNPALDAAADAALDNFNLNSTAFLVTGDHSNIQQGFSLEQDQGDDTNTVFMAKIKGGVGTDGSQFCSALVRKVRMMTLHQQDGGYAKYLILNSLANCAAKPLNTVVDALWAVRVAIEDDGEIQKGDVVARRTGAMLEGDVTVPGGWTCDELAPLLVGGHRLPLGALQFITGVWVLGNTVYVSIGTKLGEGVQAKLNTVDNGIFFSRAIVDADGLLIGFTQWQRVATSTNDNQQDSAQYFGVDALSGEISFVSKEAAHNSLAAIYHTTWALPDGDDGSADLAKRLNADLADGCFVIRDIPSKTQGLAELNSYTLFGGQDVVVLARTKIGNDNAVTNNFSGSENYRVMPLPDDAGAVQALAYGKSNQAGMGYFFAGTMQGLYVYAHGATNAGFDANAGLGIVDETGLLNGFVWQRMAENIIKGSVVALEANGTHLFVLSQDLDASFNLISTLYRCELQNDVPAMEAGGNIVPLAAPGFAGIPVTAMINGFALASIDGDGQHDICLLATELGVFHNTGNFLHNFNARADQWSVVPGLQGVSIEKIQGAAHSSVDENGVTLASGVAMDAYAYQASYNQNNMLVLLPRHILLTFDEVSKKVVKGKIESFIEDASLGFVPAYVSTFWTDGYRRFVGGLDESLAAAQLVSLAQPYENEGVAQAYQIPGLDSIQSYYGIEQVSGLGSLFVGTNVGVVTLS